MKDPIPYLLVGLFVAFACGYVVGSGSRERPVEEKSPTNYDPLRTIINDTVKNLQNSEQHCWSLLIEERRKEVGH